MGQSAYPPPDPTVGGGAQSWMSPLFPRGPIDLDGKFRSLPDRGQVPGLPQWQWLLTCGHSPGHVSFFRESDRTLIAGDAVVTTKQESMVNVALQLERVWRPPAYYTCDWAAARRSVETIAALEPEVLATGHGRVLKGPRMRAALHALVEHFDAVMPDHGRYIPYPAVTDEHGVVHVPPRVGLAPSQIAAAAAIGAAAIATAYLLSGFSRTDRTGRLSAAPLPAAR
jgi:glyoxylase-like metal-dependent hydrolase (beta-lactamase superfamily II)